jgi:hypothetical protein
VAVKPFKLTFLLVVEINNTQFQSLITRGALIMTLTKIQIVESIHNQIGLPKNKSTEILETILEIITGTLGET